MKIIAYLNGKKRSTRIGKLLEMDRTIQAERLARLEDMRSAWHGPNATAKHSSTVNAPKQMHSLRPTPPTLAVKHTPATSPMPATARSPGHVRSQKYLNGFVNSRRPKII